MDSEARIMIEKWIKSNPRRITAEKWPSVCSISQRRLGLGNGSYLGYLVGNYSHIDACGGYIHILCGGEPSIVDANAINEKGWPELFNGTLVVACDNHGNLFAVNGGTVTGVRAGMMLYMPCESFVWEPLDINYAEFLSWVFSVNDKELEEGGWKCGQALIQPDRIPDYIYGKAAAYNFYLKQKG